MGMLDSHEHKQAYHDFDGVIKIRAHKVPRYFSILFYGLVIWGALYIGYFLLSGWSSEAEFAEKMAAYQQQTEDFKGGGAGAPAPAEEKSEEEQQAEAGKLYAQHCAACHGSDGGGGIGPSLKDDKYRYGRDLAAVSESIEKGRPGGMPGFGNQLSAAQIEALANYVIEL